MALPAFSAAAFSMIWRSTEITRHDKSMLSTMALPISGVPVRNEIYSSSPNVKTDTTGTVSPLMLSWCDKNKIEYIVGLARNNVLLEKAQDLIDKVQQSKKRPAGQF
jgi:hypothetical protein